jgi:hypothetical protein
MIPQMRMKELSRKKISIRRIGITTKYGEIRGMILPMMKLSKEDLFPKLLLGKKMPMSCRYRQQLVFFSRELDY